MSEVARAHGLSVFPIVGVGASAGGLDAFSQLLRCLPDDTGFAFVLIQHLDRTHASLLSESLATATRMPVCEAEHGMLVQPSHVYVIAPNTCLTVCDGRLMLAPREADQTQHLPVDHFFRSLAAQNHSHAMGVVLSGTASDGTEGLRAIRAESGITFAQDPATAKYPGMPQSALDAGIVDYCMDIPRIAEELVRLSLHPYVQTREPLIEASDQGVREEILARVRSAAGVDFREFKPATVSRRLARRLALRGAPDLKSYLTLLDREPDEVRALHEDMLIHVTYFFRDPAVFAALQEQIFPELLKHKPEGSAIRLWIAGCSTGEEVYSYAIAWREFSQQVSASHPLQIFGSDVSEVAIQKARTGVYSATAMRDVSDERRQRYFTAVEGGYQISKSLRSQCVFVKHDLVRDPPFSKLDLLSCRNVLIYFDQSLQKRVLPTLQYCLNQPGFLVLGRSESIAGFTHLFSVVDKGNKIFQRTATASNMRFAPREGTPPAAAPRAREREDSGASSHVLSTHLDRLLMARYCPPGVLVNERLEVLLFRGQTGSYLQAAHGPPQQHLMGMARGGLLAALRATIAQAKQEMTVVRCANVEVEQEGGSRTCDVVVMPFNGIPGQREDLFVVLFEEPRGGDSSTQPTVGAPASASLSDDRRRSARLEHELSATNEYLHTLIEDHARANDELGASNEELVSGNEELQSLNEELETAKEELQSINEELTTLNDELQRRNLEVNQVNADLLNFSLTVDISIITLDRERRIRRFTPKARSVLGVQASDVGRSIHELKLMIDVPDLSQQMTQVMATAAVKELEVKDHTGHWYRMQIRPYTTPEETIDGLILSLVDIHGLKQLVSEAEDARSQAERSNRAKDDFLATLSHELRTPLSSMLLNAQRLSSGDVMDRQALQHTGESLERATRMQVKLIDDLLDVSRIVVGKLSLELTRLDLCAVVRASLEVVSSLIAGKSLLLQVSYQATLPLILADQARVQQVVLNLLTNAIKFTPKGGRVTVVVDSIAGFARVRVTDNGIGIEAGFLPHVFARFSQGDSSITRRFGGLGLGLALVRHLVELHGGVALAESAGTGHGAAFTVTFPMPGAEPRVATAAASPSKVAAGERAEKPQPYAVLAGLRILVVDDDLRTREAVLEVLQLTGAEVEVAASAAEGMVVVDTFNPQVILCDIAMPGEDGYSFIRKLRARPASKGGMTPALALTALAAEDDRKRALAAGFQLHMAKPIDIDRLREAVVELSKRVTPLTG